MLNILEVIINGAASINCFMLMVLLVFRKNNSLPNLALGGMMFIPGIYFANSVLMLLGHGQEFYTLFFISQFFAIFYTPLAAIYVYSILGLPLKKLDYVFIISAFIGIIPIYLYVSYLGFTPFQQADFFSALINNPYPLSVTIYSIVFYSFQQLVFILLLLKVNKVKRLYVNEISVQDNAKLVYLSKLTSIFVVLIFFIILLYLVFDILIVEYLLLPIIITIIYSFIVINAFKNNVVFTSEHYKLHLQQVQDNTELREIIDETSQINHELIEEINSLLGDENLLKNSELSITDFSMQLDKPINVVSKNINLAFNQNFNDLINSKRVELSKTLLNDKTSFTIEGIAYEVGFNSRATFYRAFKKHTGVTPSEFMKSDI